MRKPKITLVLSGGGAKGAFEVGAMIEMFKHVTPDALIGTSVGALNAAFVAAGRTPEELEKVWHKVTSRFLFPFNFYFMYRLHHSKSIYSNRNLKKLLTTIIPAKTFEELKIPLYVNATRLDNGKTVFFDKGPLHPPINASAALIPFYPPVKIDGVKYIDGAVNEYAGLKKAIELGSKKVIVIDTSYPKDVDPVSFIDVTRHTYDLLLHNSLRKDLSYLGADNIHVLELKKHFSINSHDFSRSREYIAEGKLRAAEFLREIGV